jgi:polyisoprenoid-binding protein YceI
MKNTFALIIALFLITSTFAQAKNPVTQSKITFQIKNLGINTHGSIGGLQANIQFDPAQLNSSVIEATADVNTLSTENDMRDNHLKGEDFFDVAHFPKITMKSVSFKHKSGNNYVGLFNVTMKDKTKQIEVPFTYIAADKSANIKGSFKLNRIGFGVGGQSLILSKEVTVSIELEVAR